MRAMIPMIQSAAARCSVISATAHLPFDGLHQPPMLRVPCPRQFVTLALRSRGSGRDQVAHAVVGVVRDVRIALIGEDGFTKVGPELDATLRSGLPDDVRATLWVGIRGLHEEQPR